MKLPTLSLTARLVLLVASMGTASALIAAYATGHIQRMESQYHQLLTQQALTTVEISLARQHLGDASALVHAALTSANEDQTLLSQEQLAQLEQAFEGRLNKIHPLLPDHGLTIDQMLMQAQYFFATANHVMASTLQWRGDRALQVLTHKFTPARDRLQAEVEALRLQSQKTYSTASQTLASDTQDAILHTWLAIVASVLLISGITLWVAWRHMSRPIGRLIHSMQRMEQRQYDTLIADQHRQDEIGSMARALQSFSKSLQASKQLQQELIEQHKNKLLVEQLQDLTSAIPGAVFQLTLRPNSSAVKLRFVSPQWAQLMGMPQDADLSPAAAAYTIRNHNTAATTLAEKHYLESARTLKPVDFDLSMQMLDGVTRWIKTRANPHREMDGSVTFNGVWLDVTKEVLQSQALEKAKLQAEQSVAEKTTLQASISHEIRTPLNAILGLTQLLLKADLPQAQREQLHHILRAGQHLRGIVNEVLDFSKIDAGQLKLESTDFSLESVVLDVLSMCQEEATKKGLTINYKMAREVPDSLRGDPHRIAQILLNYINNAIKFTATGHIHIAVRLDPKSTLHRVVLHISVKDTGPGIPADRIPLLFQAFQQADSSITRRFGGTGLGLTISRALAQLMGGSAGVSSTLGQGSTFWFTAVLEPARIAVPRAQTQALMQQSQINVAAWQGLRILVVDDNPLNRAVAEGMLHALGLQTEIAEDGQQALDKLQAVGPDYFSCVLMDIQMPQMDGLSATQALRKLPGFASLPVIAMTAHTAVHDIERAKASGMNAHLSKPLLESALHHVLQEWLGNSPTPRATAPSPAVPAELPPDFDPSAIDALAQLFDHEKLQQLVNQFTRDSLQRARQLPALAEQQEWTTIRAEAHKLTGTAATFGLMRLGHLSAELSAAVKAADSERSLALAQQVAQSSQAGVEQLQAYCPSLRPKP